MTLNDIKLNPHNPRQITGARFDKLEEYLEEYGDLSGVVNNVNPECQSLIGGHQRLRVFRKKKGKPVILQTFEPPQKDGTTAAGYIELPSGQRYTYREVFWEKAKADAATIIANGEFGQWDSERISTYFEFEPQELESFGVPMYVFGGGHQANEMSEDDVNVLEQFDPVGLAADVQRVVFIFDNKGHAEDWLKENAPKLTVVKKTNAWQVNLSTLYT